MDRLHLVAHDHPRRSHFDSEPTPNPVSPLNATDFTGRFDDNPISPVSTFSRQQLRSPSPADSGFFDLVDEIDKECSRVRGMPSTVDRECFYDHEDEIDAFWNGPDPERAHHNTTKKYFNLHVKDANLEEHDYYRTLGRGFTEKHGGYLDQTFAERSARANSYKRVEPDPNVRVNKYSPGSQPDQGERIRLANLKRIAKAETLRQPQNKTAQAVLNDSRREHSGLASAKASLVRPHRPSRREALGLPANYVPHPDGVQAIRDAPRPDDAKGSLARKPEGEPSVNAATEDSQRPPATTAKRHHRRRSSMEVFKEAIIQAGHHVKEGAEKLRKGTSKARRSITATAKRISEDLSSKATRPSRCASTSQNLSTTLGPSSYRPYRPASTLLTPSDALRAEARPRRQRANTSPPPSEIAAALPPPEQIYNPNAPTQLTYFTHCPHVSPPSNLPLHPSPHSQLLTPSLLTHPTPIHTQHLRAQAANIDLHPTTIRTIQGRCFPCHTTQLRTAEHVILLKHSLAFSPAYFLQAEEDQAAMLTAEADNDTIFAEALRESLTLRNKHYRAATRQRNAEVERLWGGFTQRWGVKTGGLVTHDLIKERQESAEAKAVDVGRYGGNKCGCTRDSCGNTIRTPESGKSQNRRASKDSKDSKGSSCASCSSKTGFGFNREGEHGGPLGNVYEEGRIILEWVRPAEKKIKRKEVGSAALKRRSAVVESAKGGDEVKEGDWIARAGTKRMKSWDLQKNLSGEGRFM